MPDFQQNNTISTIVAAVFSIGGLFTYNSYHEHRPLKALQGYANLSYQLTLAAPKIIIPKIFPHASVLEGHHEEQRPFILNATHPRVPPQPLSACWYLPISEQGTNSTCPLDSFDPPKPFYTVHFEIPHMKKLNRQEELCVISAALLFFLLSYFIWRWGQISAEEKAESERQLERFWAHFGDALAEREMAGRVNNLRALRNDILDQIVFLTPSARLIMLATIEDTLWDLEWQSLATELTDVFFLGDAQTRRLTALKWAVKELAENLDSANSQYGALHETFTIAVSEGDTPRQARDELEIQKNELAAQIQKLTTQKEDLVAHIEDLTAQNSDLTARTQDFIDQNQDLSIKLNDANADCGRVKQELDDCAARYRRALQGSDEIRTQKDRALQQLGSAKESDTRRVIKMEDIPEYISDGMDGVNVDEGAGHTDKKGLRPKIVLIKRKLRSSPSF
ncbi:MAG: hypothetical protein Q9181_001748 [Wetmoreana brouardii]